MKKHETLYEYDYLDRTIRVHEDIKGIFSDLRGHRLASKLNATIIDNPEIIQIYSNSKKYKSEMIPRERSGEFLSVKYALLEMNTRKDLSYGLRDGMSTVIAKLAILSKYNPELVDKYMLEGDKQDKVTDRVINEEIARYLVRATMNNYDVSMSEILSSPMKLDTNFNGSLYPGASIAITSYIENDNKLEEAVDYAMYSGFYKSLNHQIGDINNYDVYNRLWFWSEEFSEESKYRKIEVIFDSIARLYKYSKTNMTNQKQSNTVEEEFLRGRQLIKKK